MLNQKKTSMKKILLTAATALASLSMFAVMTNKDSVETIWVSHKILTESHKPNLITFDFSDTTALSFTKFWTHSAANSNAGLAFYKYSWDATEKALKIDVDFTIGGTVAAPATNYSAILNYNWVNLVEKAGDTKINPFTTADSVEGVFLDISGADQAKLVLNYKPVGLSDSAQVRFDISDANGRQSNQISPKHTIKPSSTYQDMTFSWAEASNGNNDWNQDVAEITDGWTDSWFDVKNGRGASDIASVKALNLPVAGAGGVGLYSLDASSIAKWNIQFDDGTKTAPGPKQTDMTFSIYVKSITIGDKLASTDDQYVFGATKRFVTGNKIVKGSKKITPNVGSKFNFEGKGILVNILGQVVATGAGSIDASSFAAGVYYIIIDNVATKVIVQ
jgi:hypothetical protein